MYSKIKLNKVRFYDYGKECWVDMNACLESVYFICVHPKYNYCKNYEEKETDK